MSGLALSIRGIDQANGFVKTGMIEEGCQMLYSSLIGHFLKKGDLKFSFSLFGLIYGRKREMIMSLVQKKKDDHVAYITLLSSLYGKLWHVRGRDKNLLISFFIVFFRYASYI